MSVAAPFDRRAVEDALYAWATAAAGAAVRWTEQRAAQPRPPYVTLAITGIETDAPFERRHDGEPADPTPGAEVEITYCALSRIVVSVNAYGLSNDPRSDARAIMDKLAASLHLDGAASGLAAAGLALVDTSQVRSLDFLVDDAFVSRTQLDVTFAVAQNVTERIGYIGQVDITNEDLGMDPFTVDLDD